MIIDARFTDAPWYHKKYTYKRIFPMEERVKFPEYFVLSEAEMEAIIWQDGLTANLIANEEDECITPPEE